MPVQWRGKDPTIFPTDEVRRDIGLQFVDIQTRIHGVDWRGARARRCRAHDVGDPAAVGAPLDRPLGRLLRRLRPRRAAADAVRDRLAARQRRLLGHLTLCHGDYRIGNFMLRDGVINGIFDWELAHVSDPVEDIAYAGLPLFRGRNPLLSQLLAPGRVLRPLRGSAPGVRVDPEVFQFWTVLGLVKAAASHLRGTRAFEDGRIGDLRLAAMGHQVQYVLKHIATVLDIA